jgi:hypothetical protein
MYQRGFHQTLFVKFDTVTFTKFCRETPDLLKMGQQYLARYMKPK